MGFLFPKVGYILATFWLGLSYSFSIPNKKAKILLDNGHGIDTPGKRSSDQVLQISLHVNAARPAYQKRYCRRRS